MIGAVVGVQPFGGHGLSGTGPKAGGPLYVRRLLSQRPPLSVDASAARARRPGRRAQQLCARPKGTILCVATRSRATCRPSVDAVTLPAIGRPWISTSRISRRPSSPAAPDELLALSQRLAERDGPIVPVYVAPYPLEFLIDEVSLSVNTAAAGGNASLMTIG